MDREREREASAEEKSGETGKSSFRCARVRLPNTHQTSIIYRWVNCACVRDVFGEVTMNTVLDVRMCRIGLFAYVVTHSMHTCQSQPGKLTPIHSAQNDRVASETCQSNSSVFAHQGKPNWIFHLCRAIELARENRRRVRLRSRMPKYWVKFSHSRMIFSV